MVFHLDLPGALRIRSYNPHFTGEEIKAQRV
jgi:hypothetical protein